MRRAGSRVHRNPRLSASTRSRSAGHAYRIVVSDLIRHRPIWFRGEDRSEKSMTMFYDWLGEQKGRGIRLAVMDMWKPFAT